MPNLDGRAVARQLNQMTKLKADALRQQGIIPGLAIIMVGTDPASLVYTRNKERLATELGIQVEMKTLPATATEPEVAAVIEACNQDPQIDGIILQSPLPTGLPEDQLSQLILPAKDVDGLHATNLGKLVQHQAGDYPIAATPQGIMGLLASYDLAVTGKRVVIIGRSRLVGLPLAALMQNEGATVTVAHRKTQGLTTLTRQADILVVATGQPELVTAPMVKDGAIVIDVGINRVAGQLVGDVDYESVAPLASWITPVPGGVGPMTVASVLSQTVQLAQRRGAR